MSTFTILTIAMLVLVVISGLMALTREGLLDHRWPVLPIFPGRRSRRRRLSRPLRDHG